MDGRTDAWRTTSHEISSLTYSQWTKNFTIDQNFWFDQIKSILQMMNEAYRLPNNKILDSSKSKAFCRQDNKSAWKVGICFGKGRKHFWKRRKKWLPAILAHHSTKCSRWGIVIGLSSVCLSICTFTITKKSSFPKLTIRFQSYYTEMILRSCSFKILQRIEFYE